MRHGTVRRYRAGCRCAQCRAANAEKGRRRRHGEPSLLIDEVVERSTHPSIDPKEALLRVIDRLCPFCLAGPFHVVASHVVRVHDLDRRAFRDLLLVPYSKSISSPEHAGMRSEMMSRLIEEGVISPPTNPGGRHYEYSHAARESWMANLKAARVGWKESAHEKAARRIRLWRSGQFTLRELAEIEGLKPAHMRQALNRAGAGIPPRYIGRGPE